MGIQNYMFDIWYWGIYFVISLFLVQDFIISIVLFVAWLLARGPIKKVVESYLKQM